MYVFLLESQIKLRKSYGYNYEIITYDGLDVGVWDLGGSEEVINIKKSL